MPSDHKDPAEDAPPKDSAPDGWDGRIDPEVYHRVLERRQQKEREQAGRFPGGKPFPVPDRDTDSVLPDPKDKAR